MKHIYLTILLAAMVSAPICVASEVNPDDLDLPETKWEMHYDRYESLWDDSPEYRNLSREVTVKGTYGTIYIKGIFEEYPDAWVTATHHSFLRIRSNQKIAEIDGVPVYFQLHQAYYMTSSATDREYTVGIEMRPGGNNLWVNAEEGDNQGLLIPEYKDTHLAFWFNDKPGTTYSFTRTYYFDGSITGDDFGPRPIYLYPCFRKIGSSGIMDTVIDQQQPEDTRVFDLSGRQVNPDRLTPGIYIRNGRKFIVR